MQSSSLIMRALLALALTIGFYVLALSIIAFMLFIPYAELKYGHSLHLRLDLLCLITAGTIIWAILPRRHKFQPPGLRLKANQHPLLFREVTHIAQQVQQAMPAEIYLVPEVNAFVAEHGGFMGLGSRRIMGIGLPLLQTFTVSELQAVLAHEFGHYHGGDTKLGLWIFKTRAAIIRTLQGLGAGSWLHYPFMWYGKLFLRITYRVSRQQEFKADELAVRTVGALPLVTGLRKVQATALAYQAFWQHELDPILRAGYYPSLTEGFSHFINAPSVTQGMATIIDREMSQEKADPYDTHPTLPERIAAVQPLATHPTGPRDDTPAILLLQNVSQLEEQLFSFMFGGQTLQSLKPITWQEVGLKIYIPMWQEIVSRYTSALQGVTLLQLPTFLRSPDKLVQMLQSASKGSFSQAELMNGALAVIGRAMTLILLQHGWQLVMQPGDEVTLARGDIRLHPFIMIPDLYNGKLPLETWQHNCYQWGIAHLDLGQSTNNSVQP